MNALSGKFLCNTKSHWPRQKKLFKILKTIWPKATLHKKSASQRRAQTKKIGHQIAAILRRINPKLLQKFSHQIISKISCANIIQSLSRNLKQVQLMLSLTNFLEPLLGMNCQFNKISYNNKNKCRTKSKIKHFKCLSIKHIFHTISSALKPQIKTSLSSFSTDNVIFKRSS